MNPSEKKILRNFIGQHLDVSGTRLSDHEAGFLLDFIDDYEVKHKGRTETRSATQNGWSSDGKYTRWETTTYTFTDDIGIREDYQYRDDDGQSGKASSVIRDARGILNWFRQHG